MNDNEGAAWKDDEARALRSLVDGSASPAPEVRSRILGRLTALGLLSSRSRSASAWAPWAAAAAFAVVGFLAGRSTASAPSVQEPGGTEYVLLLTGGASATPEENAARRNEYGAWLADLQQRGLTADGAELVGARHEFPAGRPNEPVVGYFVIAARNEAEAVAIARANPHLRHGGGVVAGRPSLGLLLVVLRETEPVAVGILELRKTDLARDHHGRTDEHDSLRLEILSCRLDIADHAEVEDDGSRRRRFASARGETELKPGETAIDMGELKVVAPLGDLEAEGLFVEADRAVQIADIELDQERGLPFQRRRS